MMAKPARAMTRPRDARRGAGHRTTDITRRRGRFG